MTEAEIRAYYQELHDTLSADYYAGTSGLTKEEFDIQHGQIWTDMQAALIADGYIPEPKPTRDLALEIDEIKTDIQKLKAK